jgi:rRNA maturation endonuclease Nob1
MSDHNKKTVAEVAMQSFIVSLCTTEVELFKERENWKAVDQLTAYFQSTPQKAAFGRLMTKAALVTECYNIKEICDELNLTRQSVHRMVNECLDADWIKVCTRCYNGGEKDKYIANQELVRATEGYARYLFEKLIETKALENENFLYQLTRHGYL